MWKKQIVWSQMKQWTIDGFVKSQIKRLRILEDSGNFKVMVGLSLNFNCHRFCTLQKERSLSLGNMVYIRTVYMYISSKVQKGFTSWTYYNIP